MYYAVIADIHSNLAAFNAVLDDMAQRGKIEELWCLGDIVGYGPEPHQCLEVLRRYRHISVAGNHDLAAIGKIDTAYFNPDAEAAARWTAQQLSPEDKDYLAGLPLVIERDDFTLVHGSPREPVWEYVLSTAIARENFAHFSTPYCLVGHSHVPQVFRRDEAGNCFTSQLLPGVPLALGAERLIINPGGIGQPRDGDSRASYATYESETRLVTLYRVAYDIGAAQAKMRQYGLPPRLIARLRYGA